MRSVNALMMAVMVATGLAGCADGSTAPDDEFEDEFQDLQATATTGIIRGLIYDTTITPLAGANITLQSGASTVSDANGLFGFDGLEPGSYILDVQKIGYGAVKGSSIVEAGVKSPDLVRILMEQIPGTEPYIIPLTFRGHLTCGVAIFVTSVGCTTLQPVADNLGDASIFYHTFDGVEPDHIQGELVWRNTQPLAGRFIWEIVGDGNDHIGYRETEVSPALAYVNSTVIDEQRAVIMDQGGIAFRFFGGPMDGCEMPDGMPPPPPPFKRWSFGCGVTMDQSAEAYAHVFYNMEPTEDWRFTMDGDHPVPKA